VATPDGPTPRGLDARLHPGIGANAKAELEIEYDGLEPPVELFAELDAAGWTRPVPVPPPSSAIDWSRPDADTGKRYSVRPYRATVRAQPTRRVAATAEAVGAIVERHRVAGLARLTAGSQTDTGSANLDGGAPAFAVTVTVPPERLDALLAYLLATVPAAQVVRRTYTTRLVAGHYRGRESEMELPAVELELSVAGADVETVRRALEGADDLQVRPRSA
jgi:hypothetical protein